MPGVSTSINCVSPSIAMPISRVRVVCTLGLTIATFCPTSALVSVDLPALGAPTIATTPQCAVICPVAPALRWRPRSRPPASSRLPPKPVRDPLSPLLPRNGAHDAHPVAEPADIPAAKGHGRRPIPEEIGRAACRERVCQYV